MVKPNIKKCVWSFSLTSEVPGGLEPPDSVTVVTHVAWRWINNCQPETSLLYFSAFCSYPLSLFFFFFPQVVHWPSHQKKKKKKKEKEKRKKNVPVVPFFLNWLLFRCVAENHSFHSFIVPMILFLCCGVFSLWYDQMMIINQFVMCGCPHWSVSVSRRDLWSRAHRRTSGNLSLRTRHHSSNCVGEQIL